MRRFPLLYPLSYVFLPPKVAFSYFRAHSTSKKLIRTRVEERHDRKDLDYMTQFLKNEEALPPDGFLVSQAGHLILDHYESSSVLTAGMCFLTTNDEVMKKLQNELRTTFKSYEDITEDKLQDLPWLNATIEEVIRLHTNVPYGLPRISPGHTVDGNYVAKGVSNPVYSRVTDLQHLLRSFVEESKLISESGRRFVLRICYNSLGEVLQQAVRVQASEMAS